jgi:hypothetical protein
MHVPTDRLRIHTAAEEVVARCNKSKSASGRICGHIQVCDATRPTCLMLIAFIGDTSKSSIQAFPGEVLMDRIIQLIRRFRQGTPIVPGLTSSDLGTKGGAVIIKDLIVSFASQYCHDKAMLDEAITLMIAIRAGLLPHKQVYSLRCTPGKTQFNPELRRLMHTITWRN